MVYFHDQSATVVNNCFQTTNNKKYYWKDNNFYFIITSYVEYNEPHQNQLSVHQIQQISSNNLKDILDSQVNVLYRLTQISFDVFKS